MRLLKSTTVALLALVVVAVAGRASCRPVRSNSRHGRESRPARTASASSRLASVSTAASTIRSTMAQAASLRDHLGRRRGSGADWFPAFAAGDPTATLGTVVPNPAGPPTPGLTGSAIFTVDPTINPFFTFASMVVPSNDYFIGNDSPTQYQLFDAMGDPRHHDDHAAWSRDLGRRLRDDRRRQRRVPRHRQQRPAHPAERRRQFRLRRSRHIQRPDDRRRLRVRQPAHGRHGGLPHQLRGRPRTGDAGTIRLRRTRCSSDRTATNMRSCAACQVGSNRAPLAPGTAIDAGREFNSRSAFVFLPPQYDPPAANPKRTSNDRREAMNRSHCKRRRQP